MSDTAPLSTQTEKLELQREAFAKGYLARLEDPRFIVYPAHGECLAHQMARKEFPDPPQPREIKIASQRGIYRVVNRVVEWKLDDPDDTDGWDPSSFTADEILALANLINNPTVSHG